MRPRRCSGRSYAACARNDGQRGTRWGLITYAIVIVVASIEFWPSCCSA